MDFILPAIIVLFLSFIFAMLGLGGASVYVPVFYWLGIPLEQAIASGLFLNIISTSIASYVFAKKSLLKLNDMRNALPIFAGIFISIPIGVFLSLSLGTKTLLGFFAAFLFLAAVMLIFPKYGERVKKLAGKLNQRPPLVPNYGSQTPKIWRFSIGVGAGIANGMLGIGGGIFIVPSLIASGINPRRAAVLSIACTLFASILGFLGHMAFGKVDILFLAIVGAAAAIGSFFGSSHLASGKLEDKSIKTAFAVLLIFFSVKLAIDFLTSV